MNTIYDFTVTKNNGEQQSLAEFSNQVLLIVNTASACGFTPQYEGLEQLQKKYADQGFSVLAFPCNQFKEQEKGDDAEIKNFCDLHFNISFQLYKKIDVNGDQAEPLFVWLKQQAPGFLGSKSIKWNFTKFLINRQGQVVKRFAPITKPEKIASDIEALL